MISQKTCNLFCNIFPVADIFDCVYISCSLIQLFIVFNTGSFFHMHNFYFAVIGTIFYFLAWFFYKPIAIPKEQDVTYNAEDGVLLKDREASSPDAL